MTLFFLCGVNRVSLLAFHLALVNNPQDALVVWTLSSVLYHGKWKEGVKAARQLAEVRASFVPEILEPCNDVSDDELAHRVANFVSIVLDAVDALTDSESLLKAMSRFPSSPCSGLVRISYSFVFSRIPFHPFPQRGKEILVLMGQAFGICRAFWWILCFWRFICSCVLNI